MQRIERTETQREIHVFAPFGVAAGQGLGPRACVDALRVVGADGGRAFQPGQPAQKKALISRVTEAMIEVEGENMRPVTWVRIQEFESGDWAIGGKALQTADVQALGRGQAA